MKLFIYLFIVLYHLDNNLSCAFLNVNNVEIYFYHYSNISQQHGVELKTGEDLPKSVNKTLPWKFFVHGWTTSPAVSPWYHTGRENYSKAGQYNIVFVDWSKPANFTYVQSCLNAIRVGRYFGEFILHLNKQGVPLENIHILGHSLGSHMSAFAGKEVAKKSPKKIGRITGLDPAGPLYEFIPIDVHYIGVLLPPSQRLHMDDANFVDVIHTDGGGYGLTTNIGHIDFYANGGKRIQPGCDEEETIKDENCSHARSTRFFVESILNNNFISRECASFEDYKNGKCKENNKANLGEYTWPSARGVYHLITNPDQPYAKGE